MQRLTVAPAMPCSRQACTTAAYSGRPCHWSVPLTKIVTCRASVAIFMVHPSGAIPGEVPLVVTGFSRSGGCYPRPAKTGHYERTLPPREDPVDQQHREHDPEEAGDDAAQDVGQGERV